MMSKQKLFLTTLFLFISIIVKSQPLPAFPGAEGFGAYALGGRGGRIIRVTNLNDSGTGSFRAALDEKPTYTNEPRIIIFDVCGVINGKYSDVYYIKYPFCTIAGQTAPGDGICLKGSSLIVSTHDVVIRGMRIRPGDNDGWTPPVGTRSYDGPDGIAISNRLGLGDIYNVIIDHCSVSWAVDENVSVWENSNTTGQIYNITFQWNISSEALENSIHITNGSPLAHSCGLLIGDRVENVSIHNNLMAHNSSRNALIECALKVEFVNNSIYNWRNGATNIVNSNNQTIPVTVDVINNFYKVGPSYKHHVNPNPSLISYWEIQCGNSSLNSNSKIYLKGNIGKHRQNDSLNEWSLATGNNSLNSTQRIALGAPIQVQVLPVDIASANVLNYAGALAPKRDVTDLRVVASMVNGTGKVIDRMSDIGGYPVYTSTCIIPDDTDKDGMPDLFEEKNGLNKFVNDGNETSLSVQFTGKEGYTNLEVYLNHLIEKELPLNTSLNHVNEKNDSFSILPISNTEFKIFGKNHIESVDIYNLQGIRLFSSIKNYENQVNVTTSTPLNGIFIFAVKSDNIYFLKKFVLPPFFCQI